MAADRKTILTHLADHRFEALEAEFHHLIEAYRSAPESEAQYVLSNAFDALCDAPLETTQHWRARMPSSPLAMLASGLAYHQAAITACGHCTVDQISHDQWLAIGRHFDESESYLKPLLDQDCPELPTGVILVALIVREQIYGNNTSAEKFFEQLLERDLHWHDGWQHIQSVREPRWGGSWEDMDGLLRLAQKKLPEHAVHDLTATHWWRRGSHANTFEKNHEDAIAYLEKALTFNSRPRHRAHIHEQLAYAFDALGQTDPSLASWQTALANHPCPEYCCYYGKALEKAGKMDEAVAVMEQGSHLGGALAATCALWLGTTFYHGCDGNCPELINHTRAIACLEQAFVTSKDDTHHEAANWLGLLYFNSESHQDLDKAEHFFRLASDGGSPYGAYNMGRLCDELGYDTEALNYYRLAATRGNEESAHIVDERINELTGEEAEAWLQSAVSRNDVNGYIALAKRRLGQGRTEEAEFLLWQGVAQPGGTRAVCVLGRALLEGRLDNPPDPGRAFQLFLTASNNKDFHEAYYADFTLTFLVAIHEKFCKESWSEYKNIRQRFSTAEKIFENESELANDAQLRELVALRKKLAGNRFSWCLRKWFGKLPTLTRLASFPEFETGDTES